MFKNLVLTVLLVLSVGLAGCSSAPDLLSDMTGVWQFDADNTMVTFDFTSEKKTMTFNGPAVPVVVKSIDTDNFILALDAGKKLGIITIRKLMFEDGTTFTLQFTLASGLNDTLSFVRNI